MDVVKIFLHNRYVLWFLLDALVVTVGLLATMLLRPETAGVDALSATLFGLFAITLYCGINQRFHLYQRLWRYASVGEVVVIAMSVFFGTLVIEIINFLVLKLPWLPLSSLPLLGSIVYIGFISVRYKNRLWTGFRWRWQALGGGHFPTSRSQVLIVGAGEAGQQLAKRILEDKEGEGFSLWIVGFVDDDRRKHGMRIHGIPVRGDRHAIPDLVSDHGINLIIIAMNNIAGADFRAILDICEQTPAAIKVIPGVFDLLSNTKSIPTIRNVTSEDLLGRKPVEIDQDACFSLVSGKTVLVTGAAGSIGSELSRQILRFDPKNLIMLDNNESGLHDLSLGLNLCEENESRPECDNSGFRRIVVGDVTNKVIMASVFAKYRPEIVFHAAAYKHVPIMEDHPAEAVRVNIGGTYNVASLAGRYGAERFVLVSTDKAVNPYNIMGATKWLCELITVDGGRLEFNREQVEGNGPLDVDRSEVPPFLLSTLAKERRTLYTAVRFGNVLGSRGSVVPTFENQIDRGGPVTVTHQDMTRYFMSIPEAASLIVQAAAFTKGDDVFMLDMGQQIRIDELARRLIRLRGLRPGVDIEIVYTGIRPGEKMTEKLLADGEQLLATPHPQIFRIKCNASAGGSIMKEHLTKLLCLSESHENEEVARYLNGLVRDESSIGLKAKARRAN